MIDIQNIYIMSDITSMCNVYHMYRIYNDIYIIYTHTRYIYRAGRMFNITKEMLWNSVFSWTPSKEYLFLTCEI